MIEKPNILFMGTPEFAVPSLEAIHKEYRIKAVVTVPDKPQGRGKLTLPSAIKRSAMELNIPVLQPEKMKEENFISELKLYNPDIIIVIAFRILPKEVFTIPSLGTFNIHGSLLPKYRGAAPINWAIINGDNQSGLTSFLLKEKVDTGDLLLQRKFDIPTDFTAGDLHDFLMPEAAKLALDTCKLLLDGNYTCNEQDNSLATIAPKIFPEGCKINWNEPAEKLFHFIHGVSPVPGAWTIWNRKRLKILRVKFISNNSENTIGNFSIKKNEFIVNCKYGSLSLIEIQPDGKKSMKVDDFLRGYRGETSGVFEF